MATLRQRLEEAGLGRVATELEALARPAIQFTTSPREEDDLPPGSSKIGGSPDLPAGAEWPIWEETPLDFLIQINLKDLQRFESTRHLPPSGLLSFFYDPEQRTSGFDPADAGSWRVLYTEADAALVRRNTPEETPTTIFTPCALSFHEIETLPPFDSALLATLHLTDEEGDAYFEFQEDTHQLGGYPNPVQNGNMELEAQLASHGLYCGDPAAYQTQRARELEPDAHRWQLLLQLYSDEGANMMWGDAGMLYFWIPDDALEGI